MARRKKEECKTIPGWLVSFSDLMSLLLTFFILLYAMSTVDVTKAMKFLSYFQGENPKFAPQQISVIRPIVPFTTDMVLKIKKRIKKLLPVSAYQIVATKEYALIRLFDDIVFEPDSVKLTPKAKQALNQIAQILKAIEKEEKENIEIRVEGHCDISEKGKKIAGVKDAWELSLKRATAVIEYFISKGVDPSMFSVMGYGNSKPLYKWKHPMLQRRNNRVELYIQVKTDKPPSEEEMKEKIHKTEKFEK
ncbi:OmpA/MotB family protein [Nitrosophilus alvini]|uniref:OmpA/MotB family protein n=1 Tax=Nitrosophilus alvini TaxID=2714855 RepID=UPI00190C8EC3|nr:flagellar motor protein MotB [Nitrosophilus alvini]